MLEATIWPQVVYISRSILAVFFTPVVALDFVLCQLVIFRLVIYECLVKSSITSIKVSLYSL